MPDDAAPTARPVPAPLLVCCGLTTLDVVQTVDRVPGPNDKVVADGLDVRFGGPAANAAATAVALGVPARLVTAIGTGPVADLVRAGLASAGVQVLDLAGPGATTALTMTSATGPTSAAPVDPVAPPVSTVLVTRSTGERAVVSVNATGAPDLAAAVHAALGDALAGATAVLVDGHHLTAAVPLAAAARSRGVLVALDGGSWKPGLADLLDQVDHAVLSADFRLPEDRAGDRHDPVTAPGGPSNAALDASAGPATTDPVAADSVLPADRLLAELLDRWPLCTAARSDGPGPLRRRDRAGTTLLVEVQPVPPQEVVDTLGAGDVLHGALAAGLARGEDIDRALAAGVRWATESVQHRGALGWVVRAGTTA